MELYIIWASLVAQKVKNLPANLETQVQSLGQEDPLEKEMATHYSILARRISWTDEPGELQSMGSQRVGHNRALTYTHTNLCQYLLPPATFESSCSFTFFFLNFWVCSGHLMVFSLNFPENPNQKKKYIYI